MIINKPTESYMSFLAVGSGIIFVLVTPLLPLYFVEFEESINGSMATVFWCWQFWQSYLVIGQFRLSNNNLDLLVLLLIIIRMAMIAEKLGIKTNRKRNTQDQSSIV